MILALLMRITMEKVQQSKIARNGYLLGHGHVRSLDVHFFLTFQADMSHLRFGFLWGAVWVCLFVLVVGPWWVGLFSSGSYPLIRLFEFIQGDLCLSAHIAPVPVQKKNHWAMAILRKSWHLLSKWYRTCTTTPLTLLRVHFLRYVSH